MIGVQTVLKEELHDGGTRKWIDRRLPIDEIGRAPRQQGSAVLFDITLRGEIPLDEGNEAKSDGQSEERLFVSRAAALLECSETAPCPTIRPGIRVRIWAQSWVVPAEGCVESVE